jgi:hypothetical protein
VSRDLIKAGMATLVSADYARNEQFRLSKAQVDLLVQLYGGAELVQRGLL